jgi:hypothetical protein
MWKSSGNAYPLKPLQKRLMRLARTPEAGRASYAAAAAYPWSAFVEALWKRQTATDRSSYVRPIIVAR